MNERKRTIDEVEAIPISVDSQNNSREDIRAGGCHTRGYDFFVSPDDDIEEIKTLIKNEMKKNRQPLMGMSVGKL